ncbi:hypothetical protein RQP46_003574 [Phenoliferia psychrophenolica]
MPSPDLAALQQVIRSSSSIVVLAGAGLSTASGLSTFRGPGGLWRTYNAMDLATPQAFKHNPSRGWEFYEYRRQKALAAVPNAAHTLLASLSSPSLRHSLIPACSSFTHITQNVDSLSVRALASLPPSASPSDPNHLVEMHGSVVVPYCTAVLLLVVGTSGTVYPAAGFATRVRRGGGKVAVFNLEASDGDDDADFVVLGKCEDTLLDAFGVANGSL